MGMHPQHLPLLFGRAVATPRSLDWVISATAMKMSLLTSLWNFRSWASFSKGIARSFLPARLSHSWKVWVLQASCLRPLSMVRMTRVSFNRSTPLS
jgi:hypothetical protein